LLQDANDDITVKIADFGFAAKVEGDHRSLSTQCGTPG
jgi:serine/threonine protein kinase